MRRTSLFQMMAGGIALGLGAKRGLAADTDAILGEWHLLDPADDEVHLPQHRMDLRCDAAS